MRAFLQWARLEEDGKVSLTNLLMYGAIVSLVMRPLDVASVSTLAAVLLNYGHRRYERTKEVPESPLAPVAKAVEELTNAHRELAEDFKKDKLARNTMGRR